ncbi:uncharacterized protein B0H18DRAFT_957770 [Fomitopsis serialis]|uniref:uncharacterized protein n=1 Tax=Fomitopsis serialis TaxID=139415 RepID=UPI0020072077|nr:uncharacterized protein B0H18DRAFT_957770 [Neoantrodia serialis]KAH9918866.1 hypothetical protein B0H18DRAFT_957770 [Neoantrodia serialis]
MFKTFFKATEIIFDPACVEKPSTALSESQKLKLHKIFNGSEAKVASSDLQYFQDEEEIEDEDEEEHKKLEEKFEEQIEQDIEASGPNVVMQSSSGLQELDLEFESAEDDEPILTETTSKVFNLHAYVYVPSPPYDLSSVMLQTLTIYEMNEDKGYQELKDQEQGHRLSIGNRTAFIKTVKEELMKCNVNPDSIKDSATADNWRKLKLKPDADSSGLSEPIEGILEFTSSFDHQRLLSLFVPENVKDGPVQLKRLAKVVRDTFWNGCKIINKQHASVRKGIMGDSGVSSGNSQFTAPISEDTWGNYATVQLHFLWANLQYLKDPLQALQQPDKKLFIYNQKQQTALENLQAILDHKQFSEERATQAVYATLQALYFPSNNDPAAVNIFCSPVMVFLACRMLSPTGGHVPPAQVPPLLAKVQFGMRLQGLYHIASNLPISSSEEHNGDNQWWNWVTTFLSENLSENNLSPFASLRDWMHNFTRIVHQMPRPGTISWPTGDTLRLSGYTISMDQYKMAVCSALDSLEEFIQNKVLLGVDLEAHGIHCNFYEMPDVDVETIGSGPFSTPDAVSLDNAASDAFINAVMAKSDFLGNCSANGITWNTEHVMEWLSEISNAWLELQPLIHMTQGLPGRATEEERTKIVNTEETRRHLFVDKDLGTLVFRPNYHKGQEFIRTSSGSYLTGLPN